MRKVLYATTALGLCTAQAQAQAQAAAGACKQTFSQNFSNGMGSFVTGSDYAQCSGSQSSQMSSYVVSQSCGAGANPAASVYGTGPNGLTLQVKPTPASVSGQVGGAAFLGSEATTKGTFSQEYGYFEITASMPQGAGLNPAFWLLPASGAWPPELDVVEMPTGSNGGGHIAYQTLHSSTLGNQQQGSATVANPAAMHTYAVDWEPNTITWYVDGVQTYQVPTPSDLHQPMYMLLDLFSGTPGSWEGAPAPGETASLNVQSVQAFSCNPGTALTQPVTPPPTTVPASTCPATPGGAATGGFTTSNGNIIAPDGSVFIAKGINVMEGDQPSAATLVSDFPGINFVRLAVYDYAGAATLNTFVSDLTSRNIVVEIEHHMGAGGGVPPLSGANLAAENAWFQALATAFKSNPYVWFGTLNEPGGPDATLAAEQASNYSTIRGTGNNTIIMFSMNVTPPPVATAGMTNVVVDQHYYGWVSGYSTDQATVTAALTKAIGTDQQLTGTTGKLPVIIGEYGNSTTGTSIDANAQQVLTAVQSSGYGSAAWAWGAGNPGDGLTAGSGLSSYGQEVAGYIALIANAPASVWATSCGAPATASTTTPASGPASVTIASSGIPGTADTSRQTAAAVAAPDTTALDSSAAAQADASNAAIAAADAQAPAVAATVQQATTAGTRADAGLARVLAAMRQGGQGR